MWAGSAKLDSMKSVAAPLTRRSFLRAGSCLAFALALDPVVSSAAEEPGYRSLFNGKDLTGWHTNREKSLHGTGGQWAVVDGVLEGQQDPPGSGNGGALLTDELFGDFDLKLEMFPDWGPDSGVFLRCTESLDCIQMYIDYHANGSVGFLAGEGKVRCPMKPFQIHEGPLKGGRPVSFTTSPDPRLASWGGPIYEYTCKPEAWLEAWKPMEWNEARITCEGELPRITTWINGLKVCVFDAKTTQHKGFSREKVQSILGSQGHIGLQVHGGKGWPTGAKCRWRNIRVRA